MSTKNVIASGKIYLGKINRSGDRNRAHGPLACQCFVHWELKDGPHGLEFSASGEAWNNRRTDIFLGGQCLETFAKLGMMRVGSAKRILEIWREWHLNDMNAGTVEQQRALEEEKEKMAQKARTLPNASRYFYDAEMTEINPHVLDELAGLGSRLSYYDWAVHALKQRGLYEVPHPETGEPYRYGSQWLFRKIPDAIVAELKAMSIQTAAA